jgi:hypothetical protein
LGSSRKEWRKDEIKRVSNQDCQQTKEPQFAPMRVGVREHIAHVAAHGRVNALRHEQRSSEITPLAAPIQMGAYQAVAKGRKLSRAEEYQNYD